MEAVRGWASPGQAKTLSFLLSLVETYVVEGVQADNCSIEVVSSILKPEPSYQLPDRPSYLRLDQTTIWVDCIDKDLSQRHEYVLAG